MVRLGKVYGNLMVDMKQTNAKLRDRGRRIVMAAGQVEAEDAARLLAEAGDMKTAIVMARLGVGAEEARKRIADAGGHVRAAVAKSGARARAPRRRRS
jgi:N-acetylmuramic acid 6-phosphate etherase